MSKTYNKSQIEIKAKSLLADMQVACPDNIWHELSGYLNEQYNKSRNRWSNKLYTPKTLSFMLVAIIAITFVVWKFAVAGNIVSGNTANAAVLPKSHTTTFPVKTNMVSYQKSSSSLKAGMADSVPHKVNTPVAVVNNGSPEKSIIPNKIQPVREVSAAKKQVILAPGKKAPVAINKAKAVNKVLPSPDGSVLTASAAVKKGNVTADSLKGNTPAKNFILHDSVFIDAMLPDMDTLIKK